MADIFISYKRDERQAVESIATKLRELGLVVWFDASMSAGETFNSEIDREARNAKAILVCWSPTARESRWVIAEAMIGFEKDNLAACYVAGPDGFSPPTPFNTSHAEDLRAWLTMPSDTHSGWKSVLRRIGKLSNRADIEDWGALHAQASATELRLWIDSYDNSPLFMTVETMLRDRERQDEERATLERAARERRAVEQAEAKARDAEARKAHEESERLNRLELDARRRADADARNKQAERNQWRTFLLWTSLSALISAMALWVGLEARHA